MNARVRTLLLQFILSMSYNNAVDGWGVAQLQLQGSRRRNAAATAQYVIMLSVK
jgi:hypothetical protein